MHAGRSKCGVGAAWAHLLTLAGGMGLDKVRPTPNAQANLFDTLYPDRRGPILCENRFDVKTIVKAILTTAERII